jgi:hypothetical protein
VARALLGQLVAALAPTGVLVVGLDETIERRWGPRIAAKGLYRDAVRSSKDYFVKVSGLRWLCLMLLVPLPWADRVWALPFLTVLPPSARHDRQAGRRHKKLTDWARQMLLQLRRWLPRRAIVVVADSGYAALELLARCARLANPIAVVTRLRLTPRSTRRHRRASRAERPPAQEGGAAAHARGAHRRPGDHLTATTIANWYGEGPRAVEAASDTAVWYHGGLRRCRSAGY